MNLRIHYKREGFTPVQRYDMVSKIGSSACFMNWVRVTEIKRIVTCKKCEEYLKRVKHAERINATFGFKRP